MTVQLSVFTPSDAKDLFPTEEMQNDFVEEMEGTVSTWNQKAAKSDDADDAAVPHHSLWEQNVFASNPK